MGQSCVGRPEDVARLALFLASHELAWSTGRVQRSVGGMSLM